MNKNIYLTLAAVGLVFVAEATENSATPSASRTDSFESATNQAAKEGKDIMVDFTGSDWCVWCKQQRSEVFDQAEFSIAVKNKFVLLEVGFPSSKKNSQSEAVWAQNARLAEEFDVRGYPSVFLLDAQGRPNAQTVIVPAA